MTRYVVVGPDNCISDVLEMDDGPPAAPEGHTVYAAPRGNAGDTFDAVACLLPDRPLVRCSVIVDRLEAAGLLAAARAALDAADLYARERWNARDAIYADDPIAIALLQSIGADPAAILAAE